MGGGDKSKAGAAPVCTGALWIEILCEHEKIPVGKRIDSAFMVRIRAISESNEDRRAPVTICAVIDKSGSMKNHLPLVKDSLQFMVQQMRAEDRLSFITFDHEVKIELPLTNMDATGKASAERAITAVKERGHTNLSGGLLQGLQTLHSIPEADATLVESVLLFTDGKANKGIQDKEALAKATSSMLTQIGRQACVFTFGYGPEHDADLLHAVADAGNGLFYYIENQDNIPDSFCDCLGGLLSVAAQNVCLTLKAEKGIVLTHPFTSYKTEVKESGSHYVVTIPDVYSEEEKCIPLRAAIAARTSEKEKETVPVLACELDYFDVVLCKPEKICCSYSLDRDSSTASPVPHTAHADIELHLIRCEVAESLGNASKMADRGDVQAARDLLTRCKQRVKKSVVFATPIAQHLMETLDESLGGMQTKEIFKEHGKAVMMNYSHSHWQQRSNTTPSMVGYYSSQSSSSAPVPACLPPPPVPVVSNPYENPSKMKLKRAYRANVFPLH